MGGGGGKGGSCSSFQDQAAAQVDDQEQEGVCVCGGFGLWFDSGVGGQHAFIQVEVAQPSPGVKHAVPQRGWANQVPVEWEHSMQHLQQS